MVIKGKEHKEKINNSMVFKRKKTLNNLFNKLMVVKRKNTRKNETEQCI